MSLPHFVGVGGRRSKEGGVDSQGGRAKYWSLRGVFRRRWRRQQPHAVDCEREEGRMRWTDSGGSGDGFGYGADEESEVPF